VSAAAWSAGGGDRRFHGRRGHTRVVLVEADASDGRALLRDHAGVASAGGEHERPHQQPDRSHVPSSVGDDSDVTDPPCLFGSGPKRRGPGRRRGATLSFRVGSEKTRSGKTCGRIGGVSRPGRRRGAQERWHGLRPAHRPWRRRRS
jgi:hypothetical protein